MALPPILNFGSDFLKNKVCRDVVTVRVTLLFVKVYVLLLANLVLPDLYEINGNFEWFRAANTSHWRSLNRGLARTLREFAPLRPKTVRATSYLWLLLRKFV